MCAFSFLAHTTQNTFSCCSVVMNVAHMFVVLDKVRLCVLWVLSEKSGPELAFSILAVGGIISLHCITMTRFLTGVLT